MSGIHVDKETMQQNSFFFFDLLHKRTLFLGLYLLNQHNVGYYYALAALNY
jgi:hypothetical protein